MEIRVPCRSYKSNVDFTSLMFDFSTFFKTKELNRFFFSFFFFLWGGGGGQHCLIDLSFISDRKIRVTMDKCHLGPGLVSIIRLSKSKRYFFDKAVAMSLS